MLDQFTYHIVNIKQIQDFATQNNENKFTYHIVNIKHVMYICYCTIKLLFTYHIVNIKLSVDYTLLEPLPNLHIT